MEASDMDVREIVAYTYLLALNMTLEDWGLVSGYAYDKNDDMWYNPGVGGVDLEEQLYLFLEFEGFFDGVEEE
jgi:hypothetical protein